jgi:hypothetical protein
MGDRATIKRRAAAAMSIAGAVGALGGVAVQVVLRQASLHVSALEAAAKTPAAVARVAATHAAWSVPALGAFLCSYIGFAGLTWLVYARPTPATRSAEATGAEVAL